MLVFYIPVAMSGFIVFASHTKQNIIDNMDDNWIKTTIIVLITGHVLTAFNIILNPVFQGIEQICNAPAHFSIKRFTIRSLVLLLVLFIAQSIPNFGPILSLIGGSTTALTSFILPCVFYVLLCNQPEYSR
jgi:vesicular inhibitory amino acid transporter